MVRKIELPRNVELPRIEVPHVDLAVPRVEVRVPHVELSRIELRSRARRPVAKLIALLGVTWGVALGGWLVVSPPAAPVRATLRARLDEAKSRWATRPRWPVKAQAIERATDRQVAPRETSRPNADSDL